MYRKNQQVIMIYLQALVLQLFEQGHAISLLVAVFIQ